MSPHTKYLHSDSVCPCHTMKRLVEIMKYHDISPNFLKVMLTQMNKNGQQKVTETLVEHPPEEKNQGSNSVTFKSIT